MNTQNRTHPDRLDLLRELKGSQCRCGLQKKNMQTFCKRCYFALPEGLRVMLYRRFGQGYEQAYAAAAEFLDKAA